MDTSGYEIVNMCGIKGNKRKLLTKPVDKNTQFIGRDNEIKEIEKLLKSRNPLVLLSGWGGIGKTELAKEYFHEKYEEYNYLGWINYSTDFRASIVNNIIESTLEIKFADSDDIDERYKRLICEISKLPKNTLFIIDNIDNSEDKDLKNFTEMDFNILLTSRNKIDGINEYEVGRLKPEECIMLFCKHYKKACDEKIVEEIIKMAGWHTLTIELLARTAASSRIDLKKFYELLKSKGFNLNDIVTEKTAMSRHRNKDKRKLFDHLKTVFDISKLNEEEK